MATSRWLRPRLLAATALVAAATVPVVTVPATGAGGSERTAAATSAGGYWMYTADGGIFAFGTAGYQGPVGNQGNDIVGMAATPSGNGYWMADDDGDVFAAGDAVVFGNRASSADDVAAFAARPQGDGYWLATRTGAVENYGRAPAFPGVSVKLSHRITTLASTASGAGVWMAGIDGGVMAFGDAGFFGSIRPPAAQRYGRQRLRSPAVHGRDGRRRPLLVQFDAPAQQPGTGHPQRCPQADPAGQRLRLELRPRRRPDLHRLRLRLRHLPRPPVADAERGWASVLDTREAVSLPSSPRSGRPA